MQTGKNQLSTRFQSIADQVIEFQILCETENHLEDGAMSAMADDAIGCLMEMYTEVVGRCVCCDEDHSVEEDNEHNFASVLLSTDAETKMIRATCYMDGEMFGLSDWIDVDNETLLLSGTVSALRDLADKFELRVKQMQE